MLRSLIANVFFLIAITAIPLTASQSARAEMPLEAWLSVAADSLDHKIGQQIELHWQSLDSMCQCTAKSFDRAMDQCRMGVGGTPGMKLVRVIDLLAELRDSGVAGVVAPAKNWNFPAENYELQRCLVVKSERQEQHAGSAPQSQEPKTAASRIPAAVSENFFAVLGHGNVEQQLSQAARLIAEGKETVLRRLEETVYTPAEPLVRAANRLWGRFMAASASEDLAQGPDSLVQPPKESKLSDAFGWFKAGKSMSYWLKVSYSAQAKLNWLTSKVRHIAKACLESIEPQFLNLEIDCAEDGPQNNGFQWKRLSYPTVAEIPYLSY